MGRQYKWKHFEVKVLEKLEKVKESNKTKPIVKNKIGDFLKNYSSNSSWTDSTWVLEKLEKVKEWNETKPIVKNKINYFLKNYSRNSTWTDPSWPPSSTSYSQDFGALMIRPDSTGAFGAEDDAASDYHLTLWTISVLGRS